MSQRPFNPARVLWPLASTIVLADCATKRAVESAVSEHMPRPVVDDVLRFTLIYNPGAAFSSRFGPYQRWVLIGIALVVLAALVRLYRETWQRGRLHVAAIALVIGGAMGNLLDRVRSPRGVVDFIDLGVGATRFYIFNVADVGVSLGAMLLILTLWRHDRNADLA